MLQRSVSYNFPNCTNFPTVIYTYNITYFILYFDNFIYYIVILLIIKIKKDFEILITSIVDNIVLEIVLIICGKITQW